MEVSEKIVIDSFDDLYYPDKIEELIEKNTDEKMVDHIRSANKEHDNDTALMYMGLKYTYSELFSCVEEYGKALKQYGLSKGDCIIICLPNTPETIFYFYACNDIGIIPYMVDPRYTFGKIRTCISDAKAKLLICEMGTYFTKIAAQEKELSVETIVVVSPLHSFEKGNLTIKQRIVKCLFEMKYKRMITDATRQSSKFCLQNEFLYDGKQYHGEVSESYDPDIPAIIVNTSGTSGTSIKGAMHSNRSYNILTNQITYISSEIQRGYTYYGYIPYFSMYGSGVGMHSALSHGIIIDNIPQFKGKKSIQEILRRKSNIIIGVPNLFESMVKICKKTNTDMSFAKLYVMGGDNVSPEKLKKENAILKECGMQHRITYGYGSTEVMMVSTTSDDERSYIYGSCGIPYPGVRYRVISQDSRDVLAPNEEGEIYVHTPTMMLGYLNKPEENLTSFKIIDGRRYFKTGDKGKISSTGHLYLTGRYKRLMKRPDGHQVSPIPIENAIQQQTSVTDCCVVGLKRDANIDGVIPTAFIKLKPDTEITEALVTNIAANSLSLLSGERENALAYTFVDAIPYTENGKMDYVFLEKEGFSSLKFYVLDDPITSGYFKGMTNITIIKIR